MLIDHAITESEKACVVVYKDTSEPEPASSIRYCLSAPAKGRAQWQMSVPDLER